MPMDFTDDQSTLVQVMAWCRQATSHYLSQCWPRSQSPYGVTRPQWVNSFAPGRCDSIYRGVIFKVLRLISLVFPRKLLSWKMAQNHWWIQHWFRWWHSSISQQAITWTNVNPDPCHHMTSLGHGELKKCNLFPWDNVICWEAHNIKDSATDALWNNMPHPTSPCIYTNQSSTCLTPTSKFRLKWLMYCDHVIWELWK